MTTVDVRVAVRNTFLVYTECDGGDGWQLETPPKPRRRTVSDSVLAKFGAPREEFAQPQEEGSPSQGVSDASTEAAGGESDASSGAMRGRLTTPPAAGPAAEQRDCFGVPDAPPPHAADTGCDWGTGPASAARAQGGDQFIILPPIYMDAPFLPPHAAMQYMFGAPWGVNGGPAPFPYPCAPPPQQAKKRGKPGRARAASGAHIGGVTRRAAHDTSVDATPTVDPEARTTVMLKNLPCEYNRAMLLELLDAEGFEGLYDFAYLPIDFHSKLCCGYGFINLTTRTHAARFRRQFQGFARWAVPTSKVAEVTWSEPLQGLEAHRDRYRDSPLMHESVPDAYRPVLLVGGKRVDFAPPTKTIRAPRVRHL